MLGRDLDGRGARSDDAIRAIRAAWGQREPRYDGPALVVRATSSSIRPACRTSLRSGSAAGRCRRCDARSSSATRGCRSSSGPTRSRTMLDRVRDTPGVERTRERPLDVALWPEPVLDPLRRAGPGGRAGARAPRARRHDPQLPVPEPLGRAPPRADGGAHHRCSTRPGRGRLVRHGAARVRDALRAYGDARERSPHAVLRERRLAAAWSRSS